MKSYWIVAKGNQSVLELREVPAPQAKPGGLVIKVAASALNRGELIVGSVVHGGPEKIGGNELSGTVHAVGQGVKGIKEGDRVMGRGRGGWSDYATMEAHQAIPIPAHMSWEQAAATPLSMLTSYDALVSYGRLKAGEWVLILGASAGAGVAALQIAQVLGAKTIGTSGSAEKLKKLEAAGLDAGIRTRAPDFADKVKEITGGKGADVAVNLVGGTYFPEIIRSLARKGRVAIVGYVDHTHHADIDLTAVHANRFEIFGISNSKVPPEERAEQVVGLNRDILPIYNERRMAPLVDRIFSFEEIPAAKAHMEADAMVGKIVVKVS